METRRDALLWALAAVLALLAVAYNGAGFYGLLFGSGTETTYPIDLRLRWIEGRLVVRGLDPQELGHPDPDLPPSHAPMATMGGSYPPWAYTTGLLLAPPLGWAATRAYYAMVCMASLAAIGCWAYRLGAGSPPALRSCCVAGVLALFPFAICISYGQYGVPIAACLAASLMALEAGRDGLAGLCLGVALVKPQLSGLFALALLIRGRFRAVAWAGLYVALATGVAWAAIGTDPLAMMRNTSREASRFWFLSHNPLVPLLADRLGFSAMTLLLGVSGSLACVLVAARSRDDRPQDLSRLFAACAIISMFWSYRRHYDTVLLAFPVACLAYACPGPGGWARTAAYLLFGGSLWLPIRHTQWDSPVVSIGHALVWSIGLILLADGSPGAARWSLRSAARPRRPGHPSTRIGPRRESPWP